MKTTSRLRYFLYLSILIMGCTTGKNALEHGDYDASLVKAVNRLQNSPQNKEAKEVLMAAYNNSLKKHLRNIEDAKVSSNVLRWERVVSEYQTINRLSDEINDCSSCLTIVPDPIRFVAELQDSKLKAAEVRYALGQDLLRNGDKASARKAYQNFEKADYYYPNFRDVQRKLDEAYSLALLRVVLQPVQINGSRYELSNQYFQDQVSRWMMNYRSNKFVAFYTEDEAYKQRVTPDQVVRLRFVDFIVGQTYVKERVEKVKKDSVQIGKVRNGGPIYGTVNATLSLFDKQITSTGVLDMSIIDAQNRQVVRQRKLQGSYVWQDQWATFKGDDRALNKEQKAITRKRESLPPPPGELFVAFTKPIYDQFVGEMSRFYNSY